MGNKQTKFTAHLDENILFKKDAVNLIYELGINQLNTIGNLFLLDIFLSANNCIELHYHPNASELIYVISGDVEIGMLNVDANEWQTFQLERGEVMSIPAGWWHYVCAKNNYTHLLGIFDTNQLVTIFGSDILSKTPNDVLAHIYCLNEAEVEQVLQPIDKTVVIGPPVNCERDQLEEMDIPSSRKSEPIKEGEKEVNVKNYPGNNVENSVEKQREKVHDSSEGDVQGNAAVGKVQGVMAEEIVQDVAVSGEVLGKNRSEENRIPLLAETLQGTKGTEQIRNEMAIGETRDAVVAKEAKEVMAKNSMEPRGSVRVVESVEIEEYREPVESARAMKPVATTKGVGAVESRETMEPAKTAEPVETAKSRDAVEPVETAKSRETVKPVGTAKPTEAVESVGTVESLKNIESVEPTESDDQRIESDSGLGINVAAKPGVKINEDEGTEFDLNLESGFGMERDSVTATEHEIFIVSKNPDKIAIDKTMSKTEVEENTMNDEGGKESNKGYGTTDVQPIIYTEGKNPVVSNLVENLKQDRNSLSKNKISVKTSQLLRKDQRKIDQGEKRLAQTKPLQTLMPSIPNTNHHVIHSMNTTEASDVSNLNLVEGNRHLLYSEDSVPHPEIHPNWQRMMEVEQQQILQSLGNYYSTISPLEICQICLGYRY